MPRIGPRRDLVGFKATTEEIDDFDARALAEGFLIRGGEPNRSEVIRQMLAYAREYMPAGWRPDPGEGDG